MCGIFGSIVGKAATKAKTSGIIGFIRDATRVGFVRGEDSTGLFQVSAGTPYLHKLAIPGPMFEGTKYARGIIADADTATLTLGHHRAATHGTVSHDNAHPFFFNVKNGYFAGVHNGTIHNWKTVHHNTAQGFDVDSEWLLSRIADNGWDVLKSLSGSWALVTYDSRTKRVVVTNNSERPLSYCYIRDTDAMLFASESGMLQWLAARNSLSIEAPMSFEAHKLYSIDQDKPRIIEVTDSPYQPPKPSTHYYPPREDNGRYSRWEGRVGDTRSFRGDTQIVTPSRAARNTDQEERDFAKSLGIKDVVVNFRITGIDAAGFCLTGDAHVIEGPPKEAAFVEGDVFPAEIRKVKISDPAEFKKTLAEWSYLQCHVIGATARSVGLVSETKLILGRPMKKVKYDSEGKEHVENFSRRSESPLLGDA